MANFSFTKMQIKIPGYKLIFLRPAPIIESEPPCGLSSGKIRVLPPGQSGRLFRGGGTQENAGGFLTGFAARRKGRWIPMMEHLFTPIKIGNVTLKSRLTHTKSGGGLDGTAKQFQRSTAYYVSVAKNGAATICVVVGTWPDCEGKRSVMSNVPMDDPEIQAGYRRMLERIHQEHSLCLASLMNIEPQDLSICELPSWDFRFRGDYNPNFKNKPTISAQRIEGMIQDYVYQCRELQKLGFDGATFYMSYRASILATAIDPVLNQRKDQWGGDTVAQRARLPLEVFRRVKEACGQDFLIEIQTSATAEEPGYDVDYWLDFCQLCQGLVDIFQVRGWDGSYTHVTGFNSTKENPYNLQFAEAFKRRGIRGLVAPVGGFGDPETMERALAEGKTDLIAMARQYIADLHFADKIKAGHPEDVTPCLRCMGKCDFPSCAVNPYYGVLKFPELFPAPTDSKRVAVLGGGPAGIRAALAAAERGHQVDLYEASDALGGQAKFSKYCDFKWNLRDYLNWMIRQTEKAPVRVLLGTRATPDRIRAEQYDALICAMGSRPRALPIPGADGKEIYTIDQVFGQEEALGHRVVVVGGGHSGLETALYLARAGHGVTLLTRSQEVYTDNAHCIYGELQAYQREANLRVVEFAATTEIQPHQVTARVQTNARRRPLTYQTVSRMLQRPQPPVERIPGFRYPEYPDTQKLLRESQIKPAPGFPHPPEEPVPDIVPEYAVETFPCDSVVVSGGRVPCREEAAAFAGCAPEIYVIGDNVRPGSIQECTLTGFAAAMAL